MSETQIAFWSAVAQISVVLALAMVVEYSRLYRQDNPDRGWWSYKFGAMVGVISGIVSIGTALFTSVKVLEVGRATSANESTAIDGLIVGFIVGVGWPAFLLLLRILLAPRDPDNPEPPSLPVALIRRIRRKPTTAATEPTDNNEDS